MNLQEVLKKVKEYEYVDMKIYDVNGTFRHVTLPTAHVNENTFKKGVGFDASNFGYAHTSFSDMVAIPDIKTGFEEPFADEETISFICDVWLPDRSKPFDWYPRNVLNKALEYVQEIGIATEMVVAPEMEFNLFDSVIHEVSPKSVMFEIESEEVSWPLSQEPMVGADKGYHRTPPFDSKYDLRNEMVGILTDLGMNIKYHHHEVGASQYEIEFNLSDVKQAADWIPLLKYVVRNVANDSGYVASFLPKPIEGYAGNGMHVHQLLLNGKRNIFDDPKGLYSLSDVALSYLAGILKHAPALLALTNPSTNSYRRLVPGFEAPTKPIFALGNRNAAIRIPAYVASKEVRRIEFRTPDATSNSHFTMAAMLLAGVDGIKRKLDPTKEGFGPFEGDEMPSNVRDLPSSLEEALDELQKDHEFLLPAFPEEFLQMWIQKKKEEIREISRVPHPLEYDLYFGI